MDSPDKELDFTVDLERVSDLDTRRVTAILDGIPGAWEDVRRRLESIRKGETIPLDEL